MVLQRKQTGQQADPLGTAGVDSCPMLHKATGHQRASALWPGVGLDPERPTTPYTGKAPDQEFRGAAGDLSLGRVTNVLVCMGLRGLWMWVFPRRKPECPGQIWTRWGLTASLRLLPPTFPGLGVPPHSGASQTHQPAGQDTGSRPHVTEGETEAQNNKLPSPDL